ncbi:response regulator [bacterium]|nr:response regulator [bacterium]
MSLILLVGLPPEMANWVEARLPGVKTEVLEPDQLISRLQSVSAQALLIEHNLPGQSGVELLQRVRESGLEAPGVFYCMPDLLDFSLSFRLTQEFRVQRLLMHPMDPEDLVVRLRRYLNLAATTLPPPQIQGRLKQLWDKHSASLLAQARELATVTEADLEDEARRTFLVKCAHQLAGTVATFGFPKASEMARLVEHSLLDGNPAAQSIQAQGTAVLQMLHGTDKMLAPPTGEMLDERLQMLQSLTLSLLAGDWSEQQLADGLSEARKLRVAFGLFQAPGLTTAACSIEALLEQSATDAGQVRRLAELLLSMKEELSRRGCLTASGWGPSVELWAESDSELSLILGLHGWDVSVRGSGDRRMSSAECPVVLELGDPPSASLLGTLAEMQTAGRLVLVYAEQPDLELRRYAGQMGVHAVFQKPIELHEMMDYLKTLATQPGGRVLALDDDPALLGILSVTLGEAGYEVTGEREPLLLWQRLEEVEPDLLILDLEMPQISGLELCKMLRGHAQYRDLPILILTAVRDAHVVESLYRAGADDYVLKPVIGNDLTRRIKERLSRRGPTQLALSRCQELLQLARRFSQPLCIALVEPTGESRQIGLDDQLSQSLQPGDLLVRWSSRVRLIGWIGLKREEAQERLAGLLLGQQSWVASGLLCLPADGELEPGLEKLEQSLARAGPSCFSDEIVMIEDDTRIADLVRKPFEAEGLTLRCLNSFGEARAWVLQQPQASCPQVVLLDVHIGDGAGYELLRMMLEKGLLGRLRVILMSAEANTQRVLKALEAGAFDYLSKPFEARTCLSRVRIARRR